MVNKVIEVLVGMLILLIAGKMLFGVLLILASPMLLITGIFLCLGLFVFVLFSGFWLLLKLLLLPVLLILLWPFSWMAS